MPWRLVKESMTINKMPNKKTLEAYLDGLNGYPKVIFDSSKGEFEWTLKTDEPDNDSLLYRQLSR